MSSLKFGKLPTYLGYQVRQAQSAVFRDFTRITKEVGLSPGEFSLLSMVAANPGVTQLALTEVYRLDKSTLSYSINRLRERGLLRRERDRKDGRYYSLRLTDEGAAVLEQATAEVEGQERLMDAVLEPGERDHLLGLLKKLSRAFDC